MKYVNGNPVVELTNFKDVQYFGPALVGSKEQKFSVVYDTGSSWFWIPLKNCTGCPKTGNKFDPSSSTSFVNTGVRKPLVYGRGSVEGYISTDMIGLKDSTPATMTFIPVDSGSDLDGQQADGLAGMGPTSTDGADLIVDSLARSSKPSLYSLH